MGTMFPDRPPIMGFHAAHRLALKLRAAGVYATGKDVLDWSSATIRLAINWVDTIHGRRNAPSFTAYLGEHMPPPSRQCWLPLPADSSERENTGS